MRRLLLGAMFLAACGDDGGGGDPIDARPGVDGDDDPVDAADAPDAPTAACGTTMAPAAQITGTEGIAIASDGTVYYSQTGHVGRWVPGDAAPTDDWVALSGTSTVWGMALAGDGTLYVATPASGSAGIIWEVDTAAGAATMLYPNAGRPNGLTVGPDGAVWYGDFAGGHVYRVDSSGNRTTVTDSAFDAPNGVLFDDDGTLLVAEYLQGEVWRVTLADGAETGRVMLTDQAGRPDGLARTADAYYVTDNGGGVVLRFDGAFANPEPVATNVSAAANMAFGRGALACTDLYVTSSGQLRVIDAGAPGAP